MATWEGTPKKFNMLIYDLNSKFHEGSYVDVEYSWEYGTVSDILTIREQSSLHKQEKLYGPEDAEALLYTLAQWYGRYNGVANLKDLLKDILDEED